MCEAQKEKKSELRESNADAGSRLDSEYRFFCLSREAHHLRTPPSPPRGATLDYYHGWNSVQVDWLQYVPATEGQGELQVFYSEE